MRFKDRKQFRLPHYNYASTNLYFVTICSRNRECLFGEVIEGKMILSEMGRCVEDSLLMIPVVTDYATIDEFVVMPNHVHGIIYIENADEPREIVKIEFQVRKRSLSNVVRNFKSAVTTKNRALHNDSDSIVWQRKFYDRIIRNEGELNNIRNYILNNPLKWQEEKGGPDNLMM
jgi:putative transposase